MKSTVILILGCVPLSVLTVWSFVELGSVQEQLVGPEVPGNVEVEREQIEELAVRVERDRPMVRRLADADLLSGEPIEGLEDVAKESPLSPLKDTWPKWTAAQQMVAELLHTEHLLPPADPGQSARPPLDELKTARQQLDKLKQEYEKSPVRQARQLVMLLERRIAALDRQIERLQKQALAQSRWNEAQKAFKAERYAECVALCDKLLADYSSVMEPPQIKEAEGLKTRAQFRDDAAGCASDFEAAHTPAEREVVLSGFLDEYPDRTLLADGELRLLMRWEGELRKVKEQLKLEQANRAAREAIGRLDQNLPPGFEERLRGTAEIAGSYPTDTVRMILRGNVKQWIEEFLPEKESRESPGLQEAETTNHEIIRGYFEEVIAPDGTLFGYKRYSTAEARRSPVFDVGTYRKEEFVVPPGEPVARRCANRYNEARDRLLADPDRRDAWVELAALCESLQRELAEYRRKRGAAQEDVDLSFENEGQFAGAFAAGSGWAHMDTLFRP